ncbi:tannase/feruloyl esterase family alpha/beta hydrolase [Curvibacter sp. CHRR-16]|uniref:tannase/feruloyl esterase family alpha/beta hydrolase n=1 Tax=Curvibacter sp. CHRR-16 TaxID=2835872 RepID=UPI001BDA2F32|nr:tannase/feruloyl esterase family alpha/beta hydrolase [Curvibacter sp. CHRR-16]MBT0570543.1 tannase/feruloyl esterase family alpha/beta hydrolase [Curvibacter sp. CHRR-16]
MKPYSYTTLALPVLASALLLAACQTTPPATPVRAAQGARPVGPCEALQGRFQHPATRLTHVEAVAAGSVTLPGIAELMPAHCLVRGALRERTSVVDGKPYAVGFEMRLPHDWNGRLFYQANGGLDGSLTPAWGDILGGGPRSNGLLKGFAVISSDAGHQLERAAGAIGGATFGVDPDARLDYGYRAVADLTPMARALVLTYYGKVPDRAYLVGTSNGGRHGMVAAARDSGQFDGIVVTTPGYRLPLAAVTQLWGAQQVARIAPQGKDQRPDLQAAFPPAALAAVAQHVLLRCDALDGLRDGLVHDVVGCQKAFDPLRDLPVCGANASTNCLSQAQRDTLVRLYAGPRTRDGQPFYSEWAWDAGIRGSDWRTWRFVNSVGPRDAVAVGFVFQTPPASTAVLNGQGTSLIDFALGFDLDRDGPRLKATDNTYRESAMDFMTPPQAERMDSFVARGGKLLLAHGSSDPVFSALDTVRWLDAFRARHGARTDDLARLYLVPGMNHSRGGPATDQFDLVDAIVRWVEQGQRPEAITATARGVGSNLPNPEVPADWAPQRTRLLCPYPQVARYSGQGDTEQASSFRCVTP